jgi:hypothetical protein
MTYYRCYFLSRDNSFMAVNVLHSDADSDAIVQATMLVAQTPQSAGFELWQGGRHVYKHVSSMTHRRPERASTAIRPASTDDARAARGSFPASGTVIPMTLSEARRIHTAAVRARPSSLLARSLARP